MRQLLLFFCQKRKETTNNGVRAVVILVADNVTCFNLLKLMQCACVTHEKTATVFQISIAAACMPQCMSMINSITYLPSPLLFLPLCIITHLMHKWIQSVTIFTIRHSFGSFAFCLMRIILSYQLAYNANMHNSHRTKILANSHISMLARRGNHHKL